MADDTMEISSENDRNIGEEDIDIDIDLTAGQVDEDYVLEDVDQDDGNPDNHGLQASEEAEEANDDLMVNEDAASYLMEDADLTQDNQEVMEEEAVPMSFSAAEAPSNDFSKVQAEGHDTWDSLPPANDFTETLITDDSHLTTQGSLQDREELQSEAEGVALAETDEQVEESEKTLAEEEDADTPKELAVDSSEGPNEQHISTDPPTRDPSQNNQNPSRSQSPIQYEDNDQRDYALSENQEKETKPLPPNNQVGSGGQQEIMVEYQEGKYTLFSTSESDAPDTFFLRDRSIIEKPIADFFAAIRDNIHEDLTDEAEIVLLVDDLGIEIEESAPPIDVSLGQIIDLYEMLLKNDGEAPQPPTLALATRPIFSRRFESLVAGAKEGKGLSELLPSNDDEGHEPPESEYPGDDEELFTDGIAKEDVDETSHDYQHTTSNDIALDSANQSNNNSSKSIPQTSNTGSTHNENHSSNQPTPPEGQASAAQPHSDHEIHANVQDEEDLIDYEDEEEIEKTITMQRSAVVETNHNTNGAFDDSISCCKPNACFCARCNEILLAEYEAKNEELRRRSLSHAADERTPEELVEAQQQTENADIREDDTNYENGIEYDADYDGGEHWNEGQYHEEDRTVLGGDTSGFAENTDIHPHDNVDENNSAEGSEDGIVEADHELPHDDELDHGEIGLDNPKPPDIFDNEEVILNETYEEDTFQNQETEQLFDLHEDESTDQGLEAPNHGNDTLSTIPHSEQEIDDFIELGGVETAATDDGIEMTSEQPLAVKASEPVDEIDYDEDDDYPESRHTPVPSKAIPTSNGGSGKRPRADGDSEDTTDGRSKEAKRARS